MSPERRPVVNTYRLQLHAGFTFDDVREIMPYLADLGITHVYLSPITTAAPGSTHGYDVIDPTRLNPELGGEEAYRRLVEEQRRADLGQVIDIVPNHMGIAPGAGNAFWEDVLRHGRASEHARLFDIDWAAADAEHGGRIVLPVLGDALDATLGAGGLTVEEDGGWLRYAEHRFPLRPGSLEERWQEHHDLRALLEEQHYLLEHWRTGKRSLTYRRFFVIDDLIGLHAEDADVFDLTHGLVERLVRDGDVEGVRVDHIDGLRDPEAYLQQLRGRLGSAADGTAPYLVVEKILEAEEPLPDGWQADGTTGYDFMNDVTRVLLDGRHADRFTETYRRLAGMDDYDAIADACRDDVVHGPLEEQYRRLAERLYVAAGVGLERAAFVEAVLLLLARITRYRTYHRADALDLGAPPEVASALARVIEDARVPGEIAEAAAVLLAEPPAGEAREVVLSLQQIMPAVQAKGQEDRAFYRYRRLLALNEVGGDPSMFGQDVDAFHARMAVRAERWPRRMLTTATHDHKLGEDVRARLAALSEFPDEWDATVDRVLPMFRRIRAGAPPDLHDADLYLLLQALVGVTPAGLVQEREADDTLGDRFGTYLVKALREAGERTDWVDGDEAYEQAMTGLAAAAVGDAEVVEAVQELLGRLAPAGVVNGLAQVVLRLGCPGVADTYQGNEFWDLTLVDPDNRRAVDFESRARALATLGPLLADGDGADELRAARVPDLLAGWWDGAAKMYTLARGLRFRRDHPALFLEGTYEPLPAVGAKAAHVIAFLRSTEDDAAIVVVPRWPAALQRESGRFWPQEWGDTALSLADDGAGSAWRDILTGRRVEGQGSPEDQGGRKLLLSDVLGAFPVAILVRELGL